MAFCKLTYVVCFLCLCGLGDSNGLASKEIFQVDHMRMVIKFEKGKFKKDIPREHMPEA